MKRSSLEAVEAWFDIAVSELQVRLLPFWTVRGASKVPDGMIAVVPRDAVDTFLEVSSSFFVRPRCLTRSLALIRFLRRRGVAAELRMGLGSGEAEAGHAWVVVGDQIIRDRETVEEVYGRLAVSEPDSLSRATGHLSIPPDVAWQTIAGEAVLVNLTTGVALGLNETGTFVWKRLAGSTPEEIAVAMVAEFDATLENTRIDVATLVTDLRQRGFVI